MKLTTTFWSDEIHTFDKLLFINGATKTIVAQTDLNEHRMTFLFFKEIAKFVTTREVLNCFKDYIQTNVRNYYQFAVIKNGELCPIKWFDLHVSETCIISHDHAFNTTLIKKNDSVLYFGKFPMWYPDNIKMSKYREFKIKSRCYKYIANQIGKTF